MKILRIFTLTLCTLAFLSIYVPNTKAEQVGPFTIHYIYQLEDPASFDIYIAERSHNCGGYLYRIRSDDAAVLERKFSIAMAAFLSGKRIIFNELDVCEGNRMSIGWIRLAN